MNIKMKSNRSKTAVKQRKEYSKQEQHRRRISNLELALARKEALDYDDEYWSTRDGW